MQVRQANLLISMLILASCGQLGTLCSLHSEQSTPSHLSMRATLQRLRGGAEPGFLQLHCENGTKKVVGEQEAPGWEGQQNPTDAGLSAMEKLQRVLARRAAHLQNATAASARASSKRSVGTESDASTDLENSSASSEEELKGAASVPVSVDKLRDDVEGEGVGEEGERSREPVHSLEELMGQIDQEKRRKAVANARAAVEQDGGLGEESTASDGESEESTELDRQKRFGERKVLARHDEIKRGITKDIAYRQRMDEFKQRLWQRPVHGEMHRIEERVPFDVGAALEKERPGQGSYDIRDFQGRRVNFELLPLEGSNPHAVKALTPEEILRLPDQQRKSGPGGGGRGMIKGRGGLERLEWRKREGMASIQDRKRDNDGNDGGATEKQRGRGGGGGKRGKGGHRPDPATRDKADS